MCFAFVVINDPYIGSNVVLVAVGTSCQLVHHYFNKMDGIIIVPLNVKSNYQIGRSPCFATIEFIKHCKIEAVIHVNYES